LRYRPFGKTGVSVSAIALTVDDRAGERGADALAGLIFAAMEAGVNTFHIEACEPEVLETVGRSLAAVERRLLFVSLRVGGVSPDALTGAIDQALTHTGLGRLDLVLLDAAGEDEPTPAALAALAQARTTGRVGLVGVAGVDNVTAAGPGARAFDVLASPLHPRSSWADVNRLKAAAHMDMGVIAYDYFPELFRQASTTPGAPRKRGLLGAIAGAPEPHPLAGAGTYAFLHETSNWTPEELCLACTLMEPSVSTVLIRAREIERLEALAAVPDRDLPPGTAAKIEMARFGVEPAASPPSSGGVVDAIKSMVSRMDPPDFKAVSKKLSRRRRGEGVVERPRRSIRAPGLANWARPLPAPDPSLWVKTVAPPNALSRPENGEMPDAPRFDAAPLQPPPAAQPSAAQPVTAIWRSKDYDYPVQPTGESFPGPDGRIYLKVTFDGSQTFVPEDEMIFPQDTPPPQPTPVDREAPQARAEGPEDQGVSAAPRPPLRGKRAPARRSKVG
jgi:aryl-alcohol dehydrogenase-like predicted oxidoreductase